jgi:hypothetical protein
VGAGAGAVTASGIDCGSDCSETYKKGTWVKLQAAAADGSFFAGWSGSGCGNTVRVNSDMNCMATFDDALALRDRIGVYRPSTGEWFLDKNGNGAWEDGIDTYVNAFTAAGSKPLVGDWNAMGVERLGVFQPATVQWHLDLNNNKAVDGCNIDDCEGPFGEANDSPVIGNWGLAANDRIGVFRPSTGQWYLDRNANGTFDNCTRDRCANLKNYVAGDLPVVGDWNGNGITNVGLFRPSTGQWFLDRNGNGAWDSCRKDVCVESFGRAGDLPISGDWDGTGRSTIGVWRPSTGQWFLDYNGNGVWDGCSVDVCVAGFGAAGDIPVIGKW